MFKTFAHYCWGCVGHAWRGSVNSAFNWASVVGIGAVGAYREHVGSPMSDPHTWEGIVGWTLVYTVVAWIIIFLARLIFVAPFRLYYEQKTRADKLEGLRQVANDASRPPSFDLGFDYSPYDPNAHYLVDNYSMLRIWAENLEHRHIEDCRISIENFGPDPIIRKGSALFEDRRESDERTTIFNLAPTEKRFFRFVDVHKELFHDRISLKVRCDQEGSGVTSYFNRPTLTGGKQYFVSMVVHGNDANSRRIDLTIDVISSSDVRVHEAESTASYRKKANEQHHRQGST